MNNEKEVEDYKTYLESQGKPYHIQYGDKREIFKRYQITLDHYDKKLIEISNLKKMLNQFDYDMAQYKSRHALAITQELDAGNTPKFKNRESRDAELKSRLRGNPEYQKLLTMSEDTGDQLLSAESKLNSMSKVLKFYEVNS